MTNVQAALLLGQLEILEEIQERKRIIFDLYRKELSGVAELELQEIENGTEPSNWMFAIKCKNNKAIELQLHLYITLCSIL